MLCLVDTNSMYFHPSTCCDCFHMVDIQYVMCVTHADITPGVRAVCAIMFRYSIDDKSGCWYA